MRTLRGIGFFLREELKSTCNRVKTHFGKNRVQGRVIMRIKTDDSENLKSDKVETACTLQGENAAIGDEIDENCGEDGQGGLEEVGREGEEPRVFQIVVQHFTEIRRQPRREHIPPPPTYAASSHYLLEVSPNPEPNSRFRKEMYRKMCARK